MSTVTLHSSLTEMQVVARHAYALTYEKEYVEDWDADVKAGKWGLIDPMEDGEEQPDFLRYK